MSGETVARWDAFLAKMQARIDETLAQAEEGCGMLLDVNALDPQPMTIAWMAIENQLHELSQKIDETFEQKVGDDAQRPKGDALKDALERKKEEVELKIFSDAARKIYAQAKTELAQDQKCAQCGASIALTQAFFRSRHLTCGHCQSVNTYVPSSRIAAVEYFCVHHLARAETVGLYGTWLKRKDEASLRAYTTAYLKARIAYVPEYEKDFEKDLEGKMAFFSQEH